MVFSISPPVLLKPPSPLFMTFFLLENPAKTSSLLKLEVCVCFLLFLIVDFHTLGLEDGKYLMPLT